MATTTAKTLREEFFSADGGEEDDKDCRDELAAFRILCS